MPRIKRQPKLLIVLLVDCMPCTDGTHVVVKREDVQPSSLPDVLAYFRTYGGFRALIIDPNDQGDDDAQIHQT